MAHIHQVITFAAEPARVFDAITHAHQFEEATGEPATGEPVEGTLFSVFGGYATGRQIELVPGKRIVQTWRVNSWPEGVHSIAHFELVAEGTGTKLTFDHIGFPAEQQEDLSGGWQTYYWEPLAAYLA